MKTFTFLAIIAGATLAAAQPWGQPTGGSGSGSPPPPPPKSSPSSGSGQCSGNQQPACCNSGSLLALDCTIGAVLGECNGVQACCNVSQDGLINLGGLCLQI